MRLVPTRYHDLNAAQAFDGVPISGATGSNYNTALALLSLGPGTLGGGESVNQGAAGGGYTGGGSSGARSPSTGGGGGGGGAGGAGGEGSGGGSGPGGGSGGAGAGSGGSGGSAGGTWVVQSCQVNIGGHGASPVGGSGMGSGQDSIINGIMPSNIWNPCNGTTLIQSPHVRGSNPCPPERGA